MLDDKRKEFLRRVKVHNVKPNGVLWIWGEEIRTYQLSKEDIRYLRWYHHDPNIAYEVDVNPPQRRNYQVAKDRNKYSGGRTKKKLKLTGLGKVVLIGSLVVTLIGGSWLISPMSQANDTVMTTHEVAIPTTYATPDVIETTGTIDNYEDNRVEVIRHLCDIYQVDYQTTYNKLRELTNDFTSDDYLNGHINGVTCKGSDVYANSEEELLTYAVRAIKQMPERFGLGESIHIHNGYSSGDDYYAQISDVSEILGVDRNLMYAIIRSETGFNSALFNESNNPAGLRGINGVDEWWRFENKEEGFLEFGMELLKYYRLIGEDPSNVDADVIRQIGDIHAPLSDGNDNWLPNVLDCLEYAQSNEYSLFGGEEIHGLGK